MRFSRNIVLMFAVFALVGSLAAQTETGQISGTVSDSQGAVLANATVTAVNTSTQAKRTVQTSASGAYVITNLQPGLYEVTIEATGFAMAKRTVQVTVGSRVALNPEMKVTGETTAVEVVASGGVQVETEKSELSEVVSGKQITELPTLNRNAYALVNLSGNVSNHGDPNPDFGSAADRGLGVNINGQRSASTNITLDGADNVDLFTATLGQQVPLDAVQEFRIINSNFSAEYGRASGGIVNVATKSGTNNFHGSLYEWYRSSSIGANTVDNNVQGIAKPRYARNQFGYSLGGPIFKDKLFFFNSTEWIRVRSSEIQTILVPTPEFIAAADPATQNFFATLGSNLVAPINGRILTQADVAALVAIPAGSAFDGLPATTPIFGQVNFPVPTDAGGGDPQNQHQVTTRVDYNITDNTSLFGRYSVQRADQFEGGVSFSPYAGYNTGQELYGGNAQISLTHAFTPNLVSQTKLVYNRIRSDQPLSTNAPGPTLYFRSTATRLDGDLIAAPGYLPFNPGSAIPFEGPQNVYQLNQDMNWTLGKHQLRFGGLVLHTRDNRTFGAFLNSVQELSTGSLATGLNNFLAGQLARFQGAVDPGGKFPCNRDANQVIVVTPDCQVVTPLVPPDLSRNNRYNDFALYVTDAWKIMPRLTLTLGARWEYFGVQHNVDPNQDANFYYGSGANIFEQIRNGDAFIAPNSPAGGLWNPDYNNFAPRVGFAWDVFGNGKTALRGGYGMAYERNFGNVTFNVLFNPPFNATLSVTPPDVGGNLPVTTDNQGPLGGVAGITRALTNLQVRHVDENIQTAYSHQWNLSVEREVAKSTVATLSYTGSTGVDLYSIENPNRVGSGVIYGGDQPLTPALLTGRLNRHYTNLNTRRNNGESDYHAMNASLRSADLWNTGLQFQMNYTWSHSIDNLSSTFSDASNNFNLGLLDPFNPGLDRGNADVDVRHRFVASATWELPYFRNSANPVLKYGLGGWTLAPVINLQTGTPFTVFDCTNARSVCHRLIPDAGVQLETRDTNTLVGQNVYNLIDFSTLGFTSFANAITGDSEFGDCTTPGQGALSPCLYPSNMTQRNAFRGPGYWNVDLGIYKTFKATERVGVQFRGELFNAFNHSNLYVDYNTTDIATQDFVGGFRRNNRNIQLGVRISF
jgi:hypothetical protein